MKNALLALCFLTLYCLPQTLLSQASSGKKPELILYRHNGGGISPLPVLSTDTLGTIKFSGLTAIGNIQTGASIRSFVTGAVAPGILPANLVFRTGAAGPFNRMVITENGRVGIGTMSPAFDLHTVGNTHTTGDFFGRIHMDDNQTTDAGPNTYITEAYLELKQRSVLQVPPALGGNTHGGLFSLSPGAPSKAHQLFFGDDGIYYRNQTAGQAVWAPAMWHRLLTDENISGTPGRIAKFVEAHKIGDSELFENLGKIGIGTTTPARKLHVEGDGVRLSAGSKVLELRTDGAGNDLNSTGANLFIRSAGNNHIYINPVAGDGKVGIGTTNTPNTLGAVDISPYKLYVQGGILTEELRVRTGWADYVFHKNYPRLPLEEIDRFIQKNGRLPKTPSEQEVIQNGLSVGETAVRQQEKIEEIYLYLIDMNKQIKTLQQENEQLKKKIEQLEKQ